MNSELEKNKSRVSATAGKLDALSPLRVISRGYALVEKNGRTVTKTADLQTGDFIRIKLSDGSFSANVKEIGD